MMIRDWNSWLNDARNIPEIPCCNISHDAIFQSDVCDDEMDSCCMFLFSYHHVFFLSTFPYVDYERLMISMLMKIMIYGKLL